jgi:aspartyl-tRNA(Asn)/glutamyl-tRNA(Gln) amidotransferase subunit C
MSEMANVISDETMEYVGILAKLELKDEEKESARQDMQKMLDYVEKLDELDTDGVEPLSHIFGDENVFRDDVVTNGDNKEAMLANAPKEKEGQYQVPKTIG